MTKQLKYKNVTWIDIERPTKEELENLASKYSIHSLALEELSCPTSRSRVDIYENYLYVILHFPPCEMCYAPGDRNEMEPEEVDFILGKDFIITVHYSPLAQLEELSKIFETHLNEERSKKEVHAGHLFFHIMRTMYHNLDEGLEYIHDGLRLVEKNVFAGQEKEMVSSLAIINRQLIDFRWALKSHKEVLSSFDIAASDFFGQNFNYYMRTITGEYERVWSMLENIQEAFADIRQTNESLLTIKTNEIMKILTIMAFVTFPLSVFTSVFGMNTEVLPLVGLPHDFWIIVGIMLVAVIMIFFFFRYKKWL